MISHVIFTQKVIPPGAQIKYTNVMDINEKYFGYGSTMSFIIFNRIENNLNILIDNKLSSTYLQSASLSKSLSNLDLVSLY